MVVTIYQNIFKEIIVNRTSFIVKKAALILVACLSLSACMKEDRTETVYIHVGENWDAVNKLSSSEQSFKLKVTGKTDYKLGENISLQVTSEKSGKLWAVYVDPDDKLGLLIPNDIEKDQSIMAGKARNLPGAEWELVASEPLGKSVIAFIVTTGSTDLMDVLSKQKSASKAIQIIQKDPEWAVVKTVIDVAK
jgi:outer membrane biogenesis lipoprotein LolB